MADGPTSKQAKQAKQAKPERSDPTSADPHRPTVIEQSPAAAAVWMPPVPGLASVQPHLRRSSGAAEDPLGGTEIPSDIVSTLRRRAGGGRPLPPGIAEPMGQQLGHDLSGVRVHADNEAASIARRVQAVAFTSGNDVYFSQGSYSPDSAGGQRLLAHELSHVAHEARGSAGGAAVIGRADDPAERAADRSADQIVGALRRQAASRPAPQCEHSPAAGTDGPVRRSLAEPGVLRRALLNNLVGNTVTDVGIGVGMGARSLGGWLVGEGPSAAPTFGPLSSGGFGTSMYTVLGPGYPKAGGEPANDAPAMHGWDQVLSRRKPANGRGAYYVRAHLLRDKFGGPASWSNLVPLTNDGNNGMQPLSHFRAVEQLIQAELVNHKTIGYKVQPVYSQMPFGAPRLAVGTLAGWLPFLGELGELLYWESLIPTALTTSWWDAESWNPVPSVRVIRNWAHSDADLLTMRMRVNGIAGAQVLTGQQMVLLAVVEALKLAVAAGAPLLIGAAAGVSYGEWADILGSSTWATLRPLVSMLAGAVGLGGLVPTDPTVLAALFAEVFRQLPWWSAAESVGQVGMSQRMRRLLGGYGGFVPSAASIAAAVGTAGAAAVRLAAGPAED
ncbi:MAG TPA: DUF4157 domain-containing protein [Jatrophihabitans sp.]|jgi:hypothetical protein|uniref:eCIS core domain-containing protein n=1 Tax=Jatrophihabitans sp. TaxID=1932789 RepID=UPI002F00025E